MPSITFPAGWFDSKSVRPKYFLSHDITERVAEPSDGAGLVCAPKAEKRLKPGKVLTPLEPGSDDDGTALRGTPLLLRYVFGEAHSWN